MMNAVQPTRSPFTEISTTITNFCSKIFQHVKEIAEKIFQTLRSCFCGPQPSLKTRSIQELTPEKVDALAELIGVYVLERLDTGLKGYAYVPGVFNTVTCKDGVRKKEPFVSRKYDPNSPLLQTIKPRIAECLNAAFSDPEKLQKTEIELELADPSIERPIIAQEQLRSIRKEWDLDTLHWVLRLKIDPEKTKNDQDLYFIQNEYWNGSLMGNRHFVLAEAINAVKQQFVTTF